MGARREGQVVGRGTWSGAPPQPDVQLVRCTPLALQQMPAHHAHHHHHHHAHLYNIDHDAGNLVPPNSPDPPTSRPPTRTAVPRAALLPRHESQRAEPARMAAAPAAWGSGAAPAPQVQELQAEQARGAEGAWDWDAIQDPLGGKALPLVVEVYGWLGWATSGTTRGLRNGPFDAMLLREYRGIQEVPPGGVPGPGAPVSRS